MRTERSTLLNDTNDYPTSLPRHALRSAMFRGGVSGVLGPRYWRPTAEAPYIHVVHRRAVTMFDSIPTDFADPAYAAAIARDSAHWSRFEEQVVAIDDCWVEPNRCQIVGPDGRLVLQSTTHRALPLYPSAWGHARRGRGGSGEAGLGEVIVYDGFAFATHPTDVFVVADC